MSEGVPTIRLIVVRTAVPELKVTVPSEVVPLKNWTMPVGVPVPDVAAATVAVSVTGWPVTAVVGAATNVVVAAWSTFAVTAVEVLVVKFVSPSYVAVIELAPSGSLWSTAGRRSSSPSRCRVRSCR